ncbi:MAG TPA: zf-HC2 domain-containing protein [Ktedonobacteraceae bacterium]|nr:zf-HC2 domain-containing protein [Ktedonobacteraceae bacterium]
MHCAKATCLIQLYVDKQLTLNQLYALEAHLSVCPACRTELCLFEEVVSVLGGMELIAEPADLTANVMRRVALSKQQAERMRQEHYVRVEPFQLSLQELATVVLLATVAMLGITLGQPSLRAALPIANGYDRFSLFCIHLWNEIISINSGTLMLAFWVFGTLLGVWITLTLVGADMRNAWFRAVLDRLPVW